MYIYIYIYIDAVPKVHLQACPLGLKHALGVMTRLSLIDS